MASLIFTQGLYEAMRGNVDFDNGTFRVMLLTSSYTESKDGQLTRADIVANEVPAGNGYSTNGNAATVTVTKNAGQVSLSLGGTTWTAGSGQTLTARKAVYYLSTGTAATDTLIAVNDFGSDQIASNGTLTLNASTLNVNIP